MSLVDWICVWLFSAFIITQIRLGFVLWKMPRRATITTMQPTGTTGVIQGWTAGIHPHHAVAYMRRTGATALPMHWNEGKWEFRYHETVNWGRDGF